MLLQALELELEDSTRRFLLLFPLLRQMVPAHHRAHLALAPMVLARTRATAAAVLLLVVVVVLVA